jgi:hypothetical protein
MPERAANGLVGERQLVTHFATGNAGTASWRSRLDGRALIEAGS